MSQRFTITTDNRVLASGFLIGRVYEHANTSSAKREASKWFAVEQEAGIVGIVSDRSHAAVLVARAAGYEAATLLDIDFEQETA